MTLSFSSSQEPSRRSTSVRSLFARRHDLLVPGEESKWKETVDFYTQAFDRNVGQRCRSISFRATDVLLTFLPRTRLQLNPLPLATLTDSLIQVAFPPPEEEEATQWSRVKTVEAGPLLTADDISTPERKEAFAKLFVEFAIRYALHLDSSLDEPQLEAAMLQEERLIVMALEESRADGFIAHEIPMQTGKVVSLNPYRTNRPNGSIRYRRRTKR